MIIARLKNNKISCLCACLLAIFLVYIIASPAHADDTVVDDINITVPTSCSLEGTGMLTHTRTVHNGTYEQGIGSTTLKVFCNDREGFAIYATGYTGDTIGATNSNKLVGNNNTGSTIDTGTATASGTSDVSNWAMKLATNASATYAITLDNGFGSYSSVPNAYTKVAHRDSSTDSGENAVGSELTTTYAAYVSKTQPADSYTGKVIYTLIHPSDSCLYYTVSFNPVSSSGTGTGTMNDQHICPNTDTALNANTFTAPTGFEFKEWNTAADGTGASYDDIESVTNLVTSGGSVTLYAIWWQPAYLYNAVANQVKTYGGSPQTQTLADMQAVITEPTSNNPATDTSNSGVFIYDASTFGAASDASNDYDIYYFRGIIDSNLTDNYSTYASSGDGAYYHDYVKMGNNTCWRIVRTTGSGGIKMIYNGIYGTTTSNSCANNGANSNIGNTSYAVKGSSTKTNWDNNKHYAGYTFNDAVTDVTSSRQVSIVFGDNSNYSTTNTTDSNIKEYTESWYANNMTDYTGIIEPSAGYCNDREYYRSFPNSPLSSIQPFTGSIYDYYPGSHFRNRTSNQKLSLTCTRGTVDLYSASSANNGNNQLTYPIAMLTVDEMALFGNGFKTNADGSYYGGTADTILSSNWSYRSYLYAYTAGGYFTMSPTSETAGIGIMYSGLTAASVANTSATILYYVRPVISLKHSVTIASGSGTATDPWLIDE